MANQELDEAGKVLMDWHCYTRELARDLLVSSYTTKGRLTVEEAWTEARNFERLSTSKSEFIYKACAALTPPGALAVPAAKDVR